MRARRMVGCMIRRSAERGRHRDGWVHDSPERRTRAPPWCLGARFAGAQNEGAAVVVGCMIRRSAERGRRRDGWAAWLTGKT